MISLRRPTLSTALPLMLGASAATAGALTAPASTSSTVQARVISTTPIVAQVATPRQVCFDELQSVAPQGSGAGALLGAIAGGVIGNAVGKGTGNAVATGVAILGGAVLGDHIEKDGRAGGTRTVRRCEQQTSYDNQVVGYNVVYEHAGQRYHTQLSHDPGATLPVQVTVQPVVNRMPAPVIIQPAPVVMTSPVHATPTVHVQPVVAWEDPRPLMKAQPYFGHVDQHRQARHERHHGRVRHHDRHHWD